VGGGDGVEEAGDEASRRAIGMIQLCTSHIIAHTDAPVYVPSRALLVTPRTEYGFANLLRISILFPLSTLALDPEVMYAHAGVYNKGIVCDTSGPRRFD
jgi:hypothetical protein